MAVAPVVVVVIIAMIIIMIVVVAQLQRVRDAVVALQPRNGDAHVPLLADPAEAAGHLPGARTGILHPAARFRLFGGLATLGRSRLAQVPREQIAARAIIPRFQEAAVRMGHQPRSTQRDVDRAGNRPLVGIAAQRPQRIDVRKLFRNLPHDPPVGHIHHTADRPGSIQKGGRAANDLHPVGCQRIDRNRMVDRRVGDVEAADPVGQDPDPLAIKAPQDRARGIRAKEGGRHARLLGQGFADGRTGVPRQGFTLQHADSRRQAEPFPLERGRYNDIGPDRVMHTLRIISVRRGGRQDRGNEKKGSDRQTEAPWKTSSAGPPKCYNITRQVLVRRVETNCDN